MKFSTKPLKEQLPAWSIYLLRRAYHIYLDPLHSPWRKGVNGRFIFIHIVKTGGTSIAKAIGLPHKRHLTVTEVIDRIGHRRYDSSFSFTVIRNPWQLVVSNFRNKIRINDNGIAEDNISFGEWVNACYTKSPNFRYVNNPNLFMAQSDWLKDKSGKIRIDYIMRFEHLAEDFEQVTSILGINKPLPQLNKGGKYDFRSYYDYDSFNAVSNWFREDIERFGYTFDD